MDMGTWQGRIASVLSNPRFVSLLLVAISTVSAVLPATRHMLLSFSSFFTLQSKSNNKIFNSSYEKNKKIGFQQRAFPPAFPLSYLLITSKFQTSGWKQQNLYIQTRVEKNKQRSFGLFNASARAKRYCAEYRFGENCDRTMKIGNNTYGSFLLLH